VKSYLYLFTLSSPLFTAPFWRIANSPERRAPEQEVKSGEEWVKSARTLFTPRNADKHRGFGAFGEE